jgi:transposase
LLALEKQLEQVNAMMLDIVNLSGNSGKNYELLQTIPGIGAITALALIAEIGDASQFQNARQLAAYTGVTPRICESGSSVRRRSHIAYGNARLRKAMYFPAISAIRSNEFFRAWAQQLQARGKCPKQVIVAVMRRLLHVVFGVLRSGTAFDVKQLAR